MTPGRGRASCVPPACARAVLLWLIALGPWPARAQDPAFSGRVIDQRTGLAVAGATVTLAGLPGTVKTDADGRFTWMPRPPLPFQVIVVLPGGQVASPVIVERLKAGAHDIAVNPVADESLTVIGAAPSIRVAPAAGTTLLPGTQIARRAPEHLLQALETVPGVNAVSEGHAAVPAIRGMARGRTVLLIDGGRVAAERRVGPSATFSDPSTFEGIDIARGPGSVAYGSDAFGGVISVRTRRAEPGSPLRARADVTLGAGTPERRASAELSRGLAHGGFIVQAHAREADDWSSPEDDGVVRNSGWRDGGLLARLDQQLGRGVLSAGVQSDFARDVERPRGNSDSVRFSYPYENSHRATASYEVAHVGGFQQLAVTGFAGFFGQRTDQDRLATASSPRRIERADLQASDFHVKGSAVRGAGPARVEVGLDVNGRAGLEASESRIHFTPAGDVAFTESVVAIGRARRADAGAYAQIDAAAAAPVRWSGGLRVDRVTTRNAGGFFGARATAHTALSGFGSATVSPVRGVSVTGQVSRGFRDPTLSDRYYRGPTGRGFATGDPDLAPETSLQLDAAVRYTAGRTQLAAYLYHYRIDDLVERYSPAADFFFFRNRGRARLRGVEIEARTALGGGFAVETGAALGRGVALDDGAALDDVAPDTITVLLRRDFGARGFAQVRGAVLAADTRPGPSEIAAPPATVVDLAGGWELGSHVALRASIRNLLDDSYYASPDPRWVWAPGRSGTITVSLRY